MNYSQYKLRAQNDITNLIADLQCQPVLMVGSGMSRRYFNAPNWTELLELLADQNPLIDKEYAYYAQLYTSQPQIASHFSNQYREWAWSSGRNRFPDSLFDAEVEAAMFLKSATAQAVSDLTPKSINGISNKAHSAELAAMQGIKPHAVITTNYDTFLELIFPDHEVVIGQEALRGMPFTIGEIYKIHGCISQPEEIVITGEDYELFNKKKKFIAARLLSLFNEHPLLICGYSAQDKNVTAILADIDEALGLPGSLIDNIYFVEYDPDAENKPNLPTEKLIQIEENRSVRVKLIVTSDFGWVFNSFKPPENLNAISAKTLRAILSRSYELVRSDIPRKALSVNFDFLERKLENSENFAELFGITTISAPSQLSAQFPYSLTEVGQKLGGPNWQHAQKFYNKIVEDTGIDIKKSDNKYHRQDRVNRSSFHKYSEHFLDLLRKVKNSGRCESDWIDMANIEDSENPNLI